MDHDVLRHLPMVELWASNYLGPVKRPEVIRDDVLQELWLLLFRCVDLHDPNKGTISTYFYQAAYNHRERILAKALGYSKVSHWRKSREHREVLDDDMCCASTMEPLEILERAEELARVTGALEVLSKVQRDAVTLQVRGVAQRHREASSGTPKSTYRHRYGTGITAMREALCPA